jgi:hypothetical protein
MKIGNLIRTARTWFFDTPERALDQAYQCALKIKAIEDEHFGGKMVSLANADYGQSAMSTTGYAYTYFLAQVNQYIKTAKYRLREFEASNNVVRADKRDPSLDKYLNEDDFDLNERSSIILEKLNFIDSIISKYEKPKPQKENSVSLIKTDEEVTSRSPDLMPMEANGLAKSNPRRSNQKSINNSEEADVSTISDKTGVLPRSILRTLNRIKQDIDPESEEAEQEVIRNYRSSRTKTAISIRFLLILVIIPLLTHQITKTFIFTPIIEGYFFEENQVLFVNQDLQEEAFIELRQFEETLRFKKLIGIIPEISPEEIEEAVKEKAEEIAVQYRNAGADGIENIFADLCSLFAFGWIIYISKREIAVLKSFMDEILYGLSDSAKAFLIILFTDIFVGYHSPHGWEVILEGIAHHFGLPESREFSFLFIATFPVILDTVLKYWIFRYLNRISPSAVATYRNMNE